MKHVHHVVGHAFLSDYDLLASIYDEVTTLIIAAVLTILDSLMLVQVLQLAEIAAQHHWNLANVYARIVLLEDHSLHFALPLPSLLAVIEVIFQLFLTELDIRVEFSGVGEVAKAGLMREYRHHTIV